MQSSDDDAPGSTPGATDGATPGPAGILRRALAVLLVAGAAGWIAGCASVPQFGTMPPEEIWTYAQEEFEEENYSNVIRAIDRLVAGHPSFRRNIEARLMRARSHFEREEYITAASEYERILNLYGSHPLAGEAALGACRAYFELSPIPQRDQTDTQQGIEACRRVVQGFPDTEYADQASTYLDELHRKLARKAFLNGEFYMKRDLYDSALIYFERVVEEYPETRTAPRALLRMVEAYREIGYGDEAEATLERLLEEYPDSPEARQVADADADPPEAAGEPPGVDARPADGGGPEGEGSRA